MNTTLTPLMPKGWAMAATRRKYLQRVGWLFVVSVVSLLSSCATTDINAIAPPVADGSSSLALGRIIYVTKCAKCHASEPVHNYTRAEWQQIMQRLSPNTLYGEMTLALMNPETRSLGLVFMDQYVGAVPGAPLPFGQSGLLVWPQVSGLIAGIVVLFTLAYVSFQRQEVRS